MMISPSLLWRRRVRGNQRLHILFFFLIEHTKGDHKRVMTFIPVIVKEDLHTSMIPPAHSIFNGISARMTTSRCDILIERTKAGYVRPAI
jgi:hypothetical protein